MAGIEAVGVFAHAVILAHRSKLINPFRHIILTVCTRALGKLMEFHWVGEAPNDAETNPFLAANADALPITPRPLYLSLGPPNISK